jgi:hypothetical protein
MEDLRPHRSPAKSSMLPSRSDLLDEATYMNFLRKTQQVESAIARWLEGAARQALGSSSLEPLETLHRVVARVVAEVQPAGRGKHVFPFNRVRVLLAAPTAEIRARIAAVIESEPSLRTRIVEQLRQAGCHVPSLTVRVVYASAAHSEWAAPQWHVEFAQVPATETVDPAPAPAPAAAAIELRVVRGEAEPPVAVFSQGRIDLGRCVEVRDGRDRLIRTNDVAFSDAAVNDRVSRRHAHIAFEEEKREYRLHDDRSAYGSSILRNGKAIAVPAGSRGVRLQPGDEILLGDARVSVSLI